MSATLRFLGAAGTVTGSKHLLDSGLGRDFTISRHDGVLYMEQTAIRCTAGAAPSRTGTATAPHR